MMDFNKQSKIQNDRATHLAAIAQTAIHGWHGVAFDDTDCPGKAISEAIGVDPGYTHEWYINHTYDVPDDVIKSVKEAAKNGSLDKLEINVTELCYPPQWLVDEFK
jgi:hypothetical protein